MALPSTKEFIANNGIGRIKSDLQYLTKQSEFGVHYNFKLESL